MQARAACRLRARRAVAQDNAGAAGGAGGCGIAGGEKVTGVKRLFLTHPPLEERIALLREL